MNYEQDNALNKGIAALGNVQSALAIAIQNTTNASLDKLKTVVDDCTAALSTLPIEVGQRVSMYWQSGVLAQIGMLAMYDAMPSVKVTIAQSLLPTLVVNVAKCNSELSSALADKVAGSSDIAQPTANVPSSGDRSISAAAPVLHMPSTQDMSVRTPEDVAADDVKAADAVLTKLKNSAVSDGVNVVDYILAHGTVLRNILVDDTLVDSDGHDFIDFVESYYNHVFKYVEECLKEISEPQNVQIMNNNKDVVDRYSRAVALWEKLNEVLELRNIGVAEDVQELARLYRIGEQFIEDCAQDKYVKRGEEGHYRDIDTYRKEQYETLKQFFAQEIEDPTLLKQLKRTVNWGEDPKRKSIDFVPEAPIAKHSKDDEKARKRRLAIKPGFWVGFAGLVILSVIGIIMMDYVKIGVLGAFLLPITVFVYVVALVFYIRGRYETVCPKCHTYYNFDTDIGYQLVDTIYKQHKIDPQKLSSSRQVTESLTYKYHIDCHCHKCGKERSFNWKTPGGKSYTDGSTQIENPERAIRQYWSNHSLTGTSKAENIFGFILGGVAVLLSVLLLCFGLGGVAKLPKIDRYVGTYYCISNYTHYTVELHADRALIIQDNGLYTQTTEFDKVKACSADDAQRIKANSKYEGSQGIALYDKDDHDQGTMLWIQENDLIYNSVDQVLSKNDTTLAQAMGDPHDYYYTYRYNDDNKVTLYPDGSAVRVFNGESSDCKFIYATGGWRHRWTPSNSSQPALVLYDPLTEKAYSYEYISSSALSYGSITLSRVTGSATTNSYSYDQQSGSLDDNTKEDQNGSSDDQQAELPNDNTEAHNGSTDDQQTESPGNNTEDSQGGTDTDAPLDIPVLDVNVRKAWAGHYETWKLITDSSVIDRQMLEQVIAQGSISREDLLSFDLHEDGTCSCNLLDEKMVWTIRDTNLVLIDQDEETLFTIIDECSVELNDEESGLVYGLNRIYSVQTGKSRPTASETDNPWIDNGDGTYTSGGKGVNGVNSYMCLYFEQAGTITLTYTGSSESGYDGLYIRYHSTSGGGLISSNNNITRTYTTQVTAGSYISICYHKDNGDSRGEDQYTISNIQYTVDS